MKGWVSLFVVCCLIAGCSASLVGVLIAHGWTVARGVVNVELRVEVDSTWQVPAAVRERQAASTSG